MSEKQTFLNTAVELAEMAGPIARAAWFGQTDVGYKSDGTALTQTDLDIETAWRALLSRRFPDHGILGEEYGEDRTGGTYTWVLDPIDGTRQFGTALLNFASLISLCRDGQPILGIIDLPLLGARYAGLEGHGARFNHTDIRVSGISDMARAKLSLANPESFVGPEVPRFERMQSRTALKVFDGGAPAYGALARGRIDICLNGNDLDPYDICALCPVVTEAGGSITGWSGETLGLHSHGGIVASASGALHETVLDVLR